MTFAGIWHQSLPSSVYSNNLPKDLRPSCLGTTFFSHNFLVKSFTVFVTDFEEIFWEKSKRDYRKWVFRIILHPIALYEVNRSCTTS